MEDKEDSMRVEIKHKETEEVALTPQVREATIVASELNACVP